MQYKKISTSVLVFLLLSLKGFTKEAIPFQHPVNVGQDSLIIKKNYNDKQFIIETGQEIKIWVNGESYVGVFQSISGDTLTLINNQEAKKISVNTIEMIKILAHPIDRMLGSVLVAAGVGAMALGGLSLVVGTAALLAENLGAIVLVAVPVLGGGGFGVYKLGTMISGKKFNLEKKWSIITN